MAKNVNTSVTNKFTSHSTVKIKVAPRIICYMYALSILSLNVTFNMAEVCLNWLNLLTIFCQFYVITPMFEMYKLCILVGFVSHLDNSQRTFDLSRSITR